MDVSKQFADHYRRLVDRWSAGGRDSGSFTEYEQETIALYSFNSNYGADGLPAYFAWDGLAMLDLTLRALKRIGADRLETIVREYAELLRRHGFEPEEHDIYDFINDCPTDAQAEFDARQTEAAALYGDFYNRWEQDFADRQAR
ncbi:MAG: hypothetical protein ACKVU4_08235 [Phycisphaerales bacterium]